MSVKYIPVQWNRNKWIYDGVLLLAVGLHLWLFIYWAPDVLGYNPRIDTRIHLARAFGSCAFLMMTLILCIGPLARMDRRFLPLLYNRRHFGVMTALVALSHAGNVVDWYFAFSPTNKYVAVLSANTSYDRLLGFPFESLGIFALGCLLVLAATSHDFWLKFLTPRVWKTLHYLIYPAYAAVVGHVALGAIQDSESSVLTVIVVTGAAAVVVLHAAAALKRDDPVAGGEPWQSFAAIGDFEEGRAIVRRLPDGQRVAVFLHQGALSAISNACAHQNGPLGEGLIIDCLVTCPWHGFQYDVTNGRSPAPFTEKVPTYRLRVVDGKVEVNAAANPPGTPVDPWPLADRSR